MIWANPFILLEFINFYNITHKTIHCKRWRYWLARVSYGESLNHSKIARVRMFSKLLLNCFLFNISVCSTINNPSQRNLNRFSCSRFSYIFPLFPCFSRSLGEHHQPATMCDVWSFWTLKLVFFLSFYCTNRNNALYWPVHAPSIKETSSIAILPV